MFTDYDNIRVLVQDRQRDLERAASGARNARHHHRSGQVSGGRRWRRS
jgi:hypothetical protein